jgi:hypothetical protein
MYVEVIFAACEPSLCPLTFLISLVLIASKAFTVASLKLPSIFHSAITPCSAVVVAMAISLAAEIFSDLSIA